MRNRTLLLISLFAISGLLFSLTGREEVVLPLNFGDDMEFMGQGGPMGPAPMGGFEKFGRWWKNARFVKELNLTDDQISRIDKIFLETEKKIIDLRASCRKAELDLKGLAEKEAEALKKIDEIYKLRAEIHKSIFLMTTQIKKELTPEQLKKLEEIKATIAAERIRHFKERRLQKRYK